METLQIIYPMIIGVTVTPVITWLKTKIPVDIPAFWYGIVLVLNAILIFGLAVWFAPDLNSVGLEAILQFLIAQVSSQATHAVKKTKDKVLLGDPK